MIARGGDYWQASGEKNLVTLKFSGETTEMSRLCLLIACPSGMRYCHCSLYFMASNGGFSKLMVKMSFRLKCSLNLNGISYMVGWVTLYIGYINKFNGKWVGCASHIL